MRRWKAGTYSPRQFYQGWMPPHPTFFVRRRCFEQFGVYRLDLGTAADYELMLRFLLVHGIRAHYIPRVLVKMRVGGASNASLTRSVESQSDGSQSVGRQRAASPALDPAGKAGAQDRAMAGVTAITGCLKRQNYQYLMRCYSEFLCCFGIICMYNAPITIAIGLPGFSDAHGFV